MRRRAFLAGMSAMAASPVTRAQPRADAARIGLLFAASPPAVAARVEAFRAALAALGYAEGAQVAFEIRYADGDLTRLPALAAELVKLPVSVIVTGGSSATRPAASATTTIPIVMGQDNDPVGSGFAASLARPGGNVTGLSTLVPELAAKQVALLAEMVPGVSRIAVFGDASEAGNAQSVAGVERAAKRLNVDVQYLDVRRAGDPGELFALAARGRAGAVLVLASGYLFARQREVTDLALRARLPALYAHPEFVRSGGLATYGVNVIELFGRAAGYVAKILGGAKPADLPIAQPTKFEFVLSLKVAKAIGMTIPQSLLLRADEVIQ
jgi:putative tryptophan/tyrosine transport system substrate-binding protein